MTTGQIAGTNSQRIFGMRLNARTLLLVSVVFGLLVSGYLSYVKLVDVPMACVEGGAFDCGKVQNSAYSMMFGIPIAWLGFATYVVLGLLVLLEDRLAFLRENGRLLVFGVALMAFIYSMWLVYVQVALLGALCVWCLLHEANMVVFFVVACWRLYKDLQEA
ncbi:MAG: vitamin K epoxide reductase family protein [Anaerolineae bacterium]|nr:vitamin K epoxide reductase family protein [Anaerolineae bacterium]MDW8170977.1 vitamin K epoxide reductase family protein [Anaerolineae bacterium]